MANTGYKVYQSRVLYSSVTNQPVEPYTSQPNIQDENHVPKELDTSMCPISVTVYSRTLSATNSGTPCQVGGPAQVYYIDNNGAPQVGDAWYIDTPGTTRLNGGGNWYYYNGTNEMHRIGSDGVITAITTC